jgi:predicted transcriptional regulator
MELETPNNYKRQYRSRIEIAAHILEIAKSGSRKTRIMYMGNLSFDLLQKYLDLLLTAGLLELGEGDERTYTATEKGVRFLEDFQELSKSSKVAESKKQDLERSLKPNSTGNPS